MVKLLGVHHIGYLVYDLEKTIQNYADNYGGEVVLRNESPDTKMAFVQSGNTLVELMEPKNKASLKGIKGQVLHHVGYQVPDIEAAMAEMKAQGIKFQDETPRVNSKGWKIAYLDSDSTLGTLVHLSQA